MIHNSVEAAKQEDSGETAIVDPPSTGLKAGPEQLVKMIDDHVVDKALTRGRTKAVENVV